jgi:hypothetical protein
VKTVSCSRDVDVPVEVAYAQWTQFEEFPRVMQASNRCGSLRAFIERARRTTAAMVGRSEKAGLLLLRDLRELYVQAQETEIDWTIARQGALAARDQALEISCLTGMRDGKGRAMAQDADQGRRPPGPRGLKPRTPRWPSARRSPPDAGCRSRPTSLNSAPSDKH